MAEEDEEKSRYVIEYNREECIGAAPCTAVSDNWILDDEGKAKPKKLEFDEDELKEQLDAAESCPVNAIHILDRKTGKRLI